MSNTTQNSAILTGRVFLGNALLVGSVKPSTSLTGRVAIPIGYDVFSGSYEVTPKTKSQTLETKNKLMQQDLTVKAIPYYEVSNHQGGMTVIIGGDI